MSAAINSDKELICMHQFRVQHCESNITTGVWTSTLLLVHKQTKRELYKTDACHARTKCKKSNTVLTLVDYGFSDLSIYLSLIHI